MPLKKGCSLKACKENYSELTSSGRSKKQAFAIVADTAREKQK